MMSRAALALVVLVMCLVTSTASAERSVVLVTNGSCAMQSIRMLDVRKAYFGIAVSYGGSSIRAFRLKNDDALNQIFYQSVVAMSEKTYERRLLSMVLKYGTPRPQEFSDVEALAEAVKRADCGIAYMWDVQAKSMQGIRIIRLLWQGD